MTFQYTTLQLVKRQLVSIKNEITLYETTKLRNYGPRPLEDEIAKRRENGNERVC